MKIIGIIPARAGSKGVPGKNIKLLRGTPLIGYTIQTALKASHLDRIVVSTESNEIAEISKQFGAEVPFLRPSTLSKDETPTIDVVIDVLKKLEEQNQKYEAVCLLQPTVPFRESKFIDEAIEKFIGDQVDSLISVRTVPHTFNPHWIFEPDMSDLLKISTGEKSIISRRQELPKAFYRDGYIYLTKNSVVLNERSLYGSKIGYIKSKGEQINIDTHADWQKAEEYIDNHGS